MKPYRTYTFVVIVLSSILRLLMIGQVGLGDDEAHYWMWSQNLDWSYFDHPPMVAWIIAFFTWIGGNHEFFVRLGAVLLFLLTSYLVYDLASRIQNEKAGFYTVLFLNVSPVFSFLGAVLMVPDGPLGLAWVLFLGFFYKALHSGSRWNWLFAGIAMGVGALSKYNAVLLPVSALLYLLLSKRYRFWLTRKEPYLALGTGLVMSLPVIVWNARHGWASFGFQLSHGLGEDHSFSLLLFFQILGAQIAYISPVLFVLALSALVLSGIRGLKAGDDKHLFLFCFGVPTLLLFDTIGSFHKILPHWPALGFITAFIAISVWIEERPLYNRWKLPALVVGLLFTLLIPVQALFKILPLEPRIDVTNELYGWPEAAEKVKGLQKEMSSMGEPVFIYSNKFLVSDQVGFYLRQSKGIYCFNEDKTQFDFWGDPDKLKGRNGIFVTDNRYFIDPVVKFGKNFDQIEKVPPLQVYRKGELIRTFYFYRCFGFKGLKTA